MLSRSEQTAAQRQRDLLNAIRNESCLDPSVPLGGARYARVESGMSVAEYYSAKQRRGQYGAFDAMRLPGCVCDE